MRENVLVPSKKKYEKATITPNPKFQKKDPFESHLAFIDQDENRKPSTLEQEKEMDQRLIELGELFEGSDIRWHLDGAFNISLFSKDQKYIGVHKDVDISLESEALSKLDSVLLPHGYGIFVSHDQTKEKNAEQNLERIYPEQASKNPHHLTIASIDKNGNVVEGKALNFVDVHLINRNENGAPLGFTGQEIPSAWLEPQEVNFKGQKLMASNPVKVLYYKLYQTRGYDQTDSYLLLDTGKVSEADFNELERVVQDECAFRVKRSDVFIKEFIKKINPGMSAEEIFNTIASHPQVRDKVDQIKEQLTQVSAALAKEKDLFPENMRQIFLDNFQINQRNQGVLDKLEKLRQHFEENKKVTSIRKQIN